MQRASKKELSMSFKTHVFVCTNAPGKEGKCGSKNSDNLRAKAKELCHEKYGKGSVRVNSSGCLGFCEKGITAVIYPEGKWHFNLTENSESQLMEAIDLCHSAHEEKHK